MNILYIYIYIYELWLSINNHNVVGLSYYLVVVHNEN